jgi:hypothetical protein
MFRFVSPRSYSPRSEGLALRHPAAWLNWKLKWNTIENLPSQASKPLIWPQVKTRVIIDIITLYINIIVLADGWLVLSLTA